MEKKIYDAYEKLFLLDGGKALGEVTKYILKQNLAKNQSEIAKKLKISASTLTAYLMGYKPINRSIRQKLIEIFKIDLLNPRTYAEEPLYDALLAADLPSITPKSFLTAFLAQGELIHSQQAVIEGLKKTNEGLHQMMIQLYDIIARNEEEIVKNMITRKM